MDLAWGEDESCRVVARLTLSYLVEGVILRIARFGITRHNSTPPAPLALSPPQPAVHYSTTAGVLQLLLKF